ncbi:MAG: hypothetical protein KDA37_14345, partial [Planctomycetales bacterium]|nr:hypothetical protein [Planctomycetales bacterium]
MTFRGALSFCVCFVCLHAATATDWPQFRGPSANGVVADTHPDQWGADENIAWTQDVPGSGWAAPVITGGKVFIATAVSSGPTPGRGNRDAPLPEQSWELHCYDLESGEQL